MSCQPKMSVSTVALINLLVITVPVICRSSSTADNFPPRFAVNPGSGSEIVVHVKEGPSSLGKEIHRLLGEDPDGDPLTFGVLGALGSDILRIENSAPNEAVVYLRKELDRETRDSYSLVLTLTDGKLGKGNFITKSMLIIVEDINDNEPVFRPFRTSIALSEESRPSVIETVEAFDEDEGRFGQVLYHLEEIDKVNGPSTFAIETVEGRGVISLVSELDYEKKSLYQLKILAVDRAIEGERRTAAATLLVRVEDAEDQPPVFTFVPSVTRVPENLPIGSKVLHVIAVDGDRGVNNAVTYSITRGARGLFAIDSSTGTVTVNDNLDRENGLVDGSGSGAYILEIQATEVTASTFPPPAVTTEVTVILTDVNDEKPTFKSLHYTAEIIENAQNDTPLKFVGNGNIPQVYDYDQGNNGTFTLTLEGYYSAFFDIFPKVGVNEATFIIKVKDSSALDYEVVQSMDLRIVARERVPVGAQSSEAQLLVQIKDANDNFPEFEMKQRSDCATVSEFHPLRDTVTVITATDKDDPRTPNGKVRFSIVDGNEDGLFDIEPSPLYTSTSMSSSMVNEVTAKIVSRISLRAKVGNYTLTIKAEDEGSPSRWSTAIISVCVEDAEDQPPVFTFVPSVTRVPENLPIGSEVLHVIAVDGDRGVNNAITYSITKGAHGMFAIDSSTGTVTVNDNLDRESGLIDGSGSGAYILEIQATEVTSSVFPPPTVTTEVTVILTDVNDEKPTFKSLHYTAEIIENAQNDTPLKFVGNGNVPQVFDFDQGNNGTFTLTLEGYYSAYFDVFPKVGVNEATFMIKVKDSSALDYEVVQSMELRIVARERVLFGAQSSEAQLLVQIKDANDNFPQFEMKQRSDCAIISEFHPLRDTVTVITATDKDDPRTPNGKIRFSIVDGNEDNLFDIEPSSSFTLLTSTSAVNEVTAKVVTRFPLRSRVGNYTLTVKAEDEGSPSRWSTSMISICVIDVNDRYPQFIFPPSNQTIRIAENATVGSTVVEIKAIDEDVGQNAVVNYKLRELSNGHWKSFKIDRTSGLITLQRTLDRERQKVYELRVEAFDLGEPTSLSTNLDLTVLVTNVDDCDAEFPQDTFRVMFTENVLPNQEVFKILSTVDKDEMDYPLEQGIKSIPCYYIVGGNDENTFKLDILTHQLTTRRSLDREEKSNYSLIVQATNDCLKEPKPVSKFDAKDNSLLQVLVEVKDVNDNPPRFAKPIFTGGVTTEMDFGTIFMTVKASDIDYGANSVVHYYIIGPQKKYLSVGLDSIKEEPFLINRKSGEISLNFDPQRNMKGYFEFDILANDTDGLADSAKVKIYLMREDQRVRFVLRLTPYELRERLDKFRDVLGNITGAIVNVDGYKFHANSDGSVDKKKTDLYLHFVNPLDNSIMDVNSVLTLIDKNIEYLDELYKEFNVLISDTSQSRQEFLTFDDQIKACLMGSTAFLVLLLILVTCLCLNQRSRYERRLKAATVSAFGHRDPQLNRTDVPNTNIHADEGSNPIWMTGYDNEWFKDDEQISHNSGGNNSLDENAVGEVANGPLTPTDSLNGSARGSGSDSSTNDRQALCRGVTGGRLTPQNITLPSTKTSNKKPIAPKPPTSVTTHSSPSSAKDNKIMCKNSINTVYITSPYGEQQQFHSNHNLHNHLVNNLSIMNLETTEL